MDETEQGHGRYDVVVIGGGAAGLSGALALGRARRSVLVIDEGRPRNTPAGHVHNYLGREGTPPADLLAIGRGEVEQYGVQLRAGLATSATKDDDGTFTVVGPGGSVRARRLLVTTGLVDELPDVPGVAEGWGETVLHCPYCHGWEVRDQAIGVLATGPQALHQAQLFRQLSRDVVLFRHTAPALTEEQAEQLAARDIRVVEGLVQAWEGDGVRMASGDVVPRQALVVGPPARARADVLVELGLEARELRVDGHLVGTYVAADPSGLTAVPGVWVAGNVADPKGQVITSAAGGLMAGAAINADLIAEEMASAIESLRYFSEPAWEERYNTKEHAIWSGNPNAVLVTEASDLAPGSALDVGCGEGADALWLAERGWHVTGTDISTVALGRAAAHGVSRGLDVEWRHVDLLADPPEPGAYDLVTAHFMQLPEIKRIALYASLAAAVAPGGTLLLVGHHPSILHAASGRTHMVDAMFTEGQLVAELDPQVWDVVVAEARPRRAINHDGEEVALVDTVVRAVRRA